METRLICASCGACAGHTKDRNGARCRHCSSRKVQFQERTKNGWITLDEMHDSSAVHMLNMIKEKQ